MRILYKALNGHLVSLLLNEMDTMRTNIEFQGAGRAAFQFKWEGPTYSLDSVSSSLTPSSCLGGIAN